jgi:predicted HAD superfamily hydrolase
MLKKEMKNNSKIIIYELVYLSTKLRGSESYTVLTRCTIRFAGT